VGLGVEKVAMGHVSVQVLMAYVVSIIELIRLSSGGTITGSKKLQFQKATSQRITN
jgi:hypothetical protein